MLGGHGGPPLRIAAIAAVLLVTLRAQEPTVALTNARILDTVEGRYTPAAAVMLTAGRISAIHATLPASFPEATERIDLAGATIVPGLGDMAVTAAGRGSIAADYFYLSSLAYGVTMMRTIEVPALWASAQRDRAASGSLLAPNLWTSGNGLEQRGLDRRPGTDLDAVGFRDWAAAARAVESQTKAKVDWIRMRGNVTPESVRAIVASARAGGARVSGVALSTPMAQMAQLGVHAVDGLGTPGKTTDEIDRVLAKQSSIAAPDEVTLIDMAWEQSRPEEVKSAIAAMVKGRISLVSLLDRDAVRTQPGEIVKRPEVAALPEALRAGISAIAAQSPASPRTKKVRPVQYAFVRDFVKAGGTIVTGTGADARGFPVPGAGVHAEILRLVDAGLTPADAIRAATIACARMVGAEKVLGQIKTGYRADLFAVDGDPLQQVADLSRIRLIVRNGEVLDRKQLLAMAMRAASGR